MNLKLTLPEGIKGIKKLNLPKGIKPWVAAAIALYLGLFSYYAIMGFQFWNQHSREYELRAENKRLSDIVQRPGRELAPLQANLAASEQEVDGTRSLFGSGETDSLMALAAGAASAAGTNLSWVALAPTSNKTVGDIRYLLQPVDMRVSGDLEQILAFLSLLHQQAPSMEVAKLELGSLRDAPAATLQLLFYLSPQAAAKEGKT